MSIRCPRGAMRSVWIQAEAAGLFSWQLCCFAMTGTGQNISDALGCTENQSTRVSLCSVLQTNAIVWNLLFFFHFNLLMVFSFPSQLSRTCSPLCFSAGSQPNISKLFPLSGQRFSKQYWWSKFLSETKRNMLPGALVYGVKAIPAEKSLQMKSDKHFPSLP